MKISIHAGHAPSGGIGCGATGYCDESRIARCIVEGIVNEFTLYDVEFADFTVNKSMNQKEVLKNLESNINAYGADFNLSIHLNSFADTDSNGCECIVHPNTNEENKRFAKLICDTISSIYNLNNRGLKTNKNLYILNKTEKPMIIVESGFCTNYNDSNILMKYAESIGRTIADTYINMIKAEKKKLYTVKVYNVDYETAKKLTDIAYDADAVYQRIEV